METVENKKKILIAEDEKPMARALELKLTHEGYDVVAVSNGGAALEAVDQGQFDIILCDLVMPKVDGFEVLEGLKERGVTAPVIILSNLSQEEDEKKAAALGAKDFYIKSNTPIADIVKHVKEALG